MRLQNACARNGGRTLPLSPPGSDSVLRSSVNPKGKGDKDAPVRMKRNEAYHPNRVVYASWNAVLALVSKAHEGGRGGQDATGLKDAAFQREGGASACDVGFVRVVDMRCSPSSAFFSLRVWCETGELTEAKVDGGEKDDLRL